MELNIDNWINRVVEKLKEKFASRLLFVGLQGSYNRGEATDESDIDLVVIIDELNFEDLKTYRSIIEKMPFKEKACGFISGREELQNWSKSDLFQFFHDTRPLVGKLDDIIQPPSRADIKNSIKVSSENLYHAAVHSFVHSNNYVEDLQNLYKMTFFILQAEYFIEENIYVPTKKELLAKLDGLNKEILEICINRKNIINLEMSENFYKMLIEWCAERI